MSFLAPEDFYLLLWLGQAKLLNLRELVDTEDAPDILAVLRLCQLRIRQSKRAGAYLSSFLAEACGVPSVSDVVSTV